MRIIGWGADACSSDLDVIAQRAAARLHAEIDAAEAMYRRHVEHMLHCVEVSASFPLEDGYLYRTQLTSVVRKLTAHVDELMLLLGGRGIRLDSPLTRVWLDMMAARANPGNDQIGRASCREREGQSVEI